MKSETYPDSLIEEYNLLMGAYPEHYKLREEVSKILHHYLQNNYTIILDIGCGSGETTKYILKTINNAKIIAVDNDERMIGRLKNIFAKEIANGQLVPVCQDIFEYLKNIETSHFDAITSSWTIHNFKNYDRTNLLKEIFRTLKPKGIFVNMDKYVLDDPTKEKESFDKAVNNLKLLSNKNISKRAIEHEEEDRHPAIIMKEKESGLEMKNLGFKDITFHTRIGREIVMSCFK